MKQEIRIIGGLYRGKKIHFPDIEGLRPTPDRVRETLFNWLMHDIKNARCLDAFAGSGALGLEAYSRGASRVVLVEQALGAYQHLQKVLSQFKTSKLNLVKADTTLFLKQCKESFDIIFLDPPFAKNYLEPCITDIVHNQLLVTGGLLYVESPDAVDLDENHWKPIKSKQAGQVFYSLFEKS